MLIGQVIQKRQDHPLGANLMAGIGKGKIAMQHIHILTFGPPMPVPWIPPYANFYPYSPWDKYDSSAHFSSYFRSSHKDHAAPKRPTFNK